MENMAVRQMWQKLLVSQIVEILEMLTKEMHSFLHHPPWGNNPEPFYFLLLQANAVNKLQGGDYIANTYFF